MPRWVEQAAQAQRDGDASRAAEALEALCRLVPGEPQHWKQLARAFQQLGRPLEAVSALVRAVDLYTKAEGGIQAIAVCKWILELDPTHTRTLDRLSRLQEASGMPGATVTRVRGSRMPSSRIPRRRDALAEPDGRREPDGPTRPARRARPAAGRVAGPPIEEVMLHDVVEPTSLANDEGQREISLERIATPASAGDPRRTARGLVSTPLFGRLGASALRRLIEATRLVRLSEGEVLFRQGDPADALYVVVEGAVVPIAEDGTRHRLSVLQPGEFFGEIALVTDEPRNATIEALVDSELLAIDRDVIGELLEDEPEVLAVTLRFLRERLVARLLTTSPVFHGIDREESAQLIRAFRLLEVQEGAVLIGQGAPARALFLVLAGELRVIEEQRDCDKEIATLRAGDPCGEMSLLERAPAVASVIACRKSWLLLLPRAEFARIVSLHPRLGKRLSWIAGARRRKP